MEYCGGGSVSDVMHVDDTPLNEHQIAHVTREALKVRAYGMGVWARIYTCKIHRPSPFVIAMS